MGLNPDAVGYKTDPVVHQYRWQDAVLYALGIGASADDLDFLYEERGPKLYPSYAVVPAYQALFHAWQKVGGDLLGMVHHGQKITLFKPFAGEGSLTSVAKVVGVYDLRRMAQVVIATESRDQTGELVSETECSIIFRFDGNFGGEMPPRRHAHHPPKRKPDFEIAQKVSPEQAILYRLNGDHNPLHIDPAVATAAGFAKPILHGLCTYGFACRALLKEVLGNDPAKLKSLAVEFRKPVWPGDTLVTEGWQEPGEIVLRAYSRERPGDYVLQNAFATVC
jgi:acyl dehydratase